MTTLYDLLGALPGSDADDLRDAFRRAVKGVHPDIYPNDPEAALKFRLIVYAMEVLRDPDQRAAYDHLLDLARQELVSQQIAAKIRTLAFAMIGLAGISVVAIAAHVLLAPMSALPPVVRQIDPPSREQPEIASKSPSAPPALNDNAATAGRNAEAAKPAENHDDFLSRWGANDTDTTADHEADTMNPAQEPNNGPPRSDANDNDAPAGRDAETTATATTRDDLPPPSGANDNRAPADRNAETATVTKPPETPVVPPSANPPAQHDDADEVTARVAPYDRNDPSAVMHAQGIAAYRNGDLKRALTDFTRAIDLNPGFTIAYVNRGIVLYRMGKLDRALADVARARRIDRAGRAKSAAAVHRRRRHDESSIAASMQAAGS